MSATVIDTPEGIRAWHLLSQRSALRLEIMGLRHSRGSVSAHLKKTYGFKGNKQKVLEQFEAMLIKEGIQFTK